MKFNNAAVHGLENKAANGKMSVQEEAAEPRPTRA